MKKRKKKQLWKKLIICLLIFFFPILVLYFWLKININSNLEIEYGNVLTWNLLLKNDFNLEWKSGTDFSNITEVGDYNFKISYLFFNYQIHVRIKDSTSPEVVLKSITQYLDEELPKATDFIVAIDDLSSYEIDPITIDKKIGEQLIRIKVTDKYGNSTIKETTLTLLEYKELPSFSGLDDLIVEYGNIPDLKKNVYANDKRFGELDFTIDDSRVNYYKNGTYTIIYSASNPLGNSITGTRKITIKEPSKTYRIENFPTYSQYPNYPNGCESIALYTLLKYYNINVTPEDIVNKLKKGSGPYRENGVLYGGDPEIEFVGDPRDKHGYGVYQKPIIDVANQYKSGMIDYSGNSLSQVLEIVKKNIPIQVWVSINLEDTKKCTSWIHPISGKKIDWICNLHSVVIIGFNSNKIIVSDPYIGSIVEYDYKQFEKMYNLFGKRAIYYEK